MAQRRQRRKFVQLHCLGLLQLLLLAREAGAADSLTETGDLFFFILRLLLGRFAQFASSSLRGSRLRLS